MSGTPRHPDGAPWAPRAWMHRLASVSGVVIAVALAKPAVAAPFPAEHFQLAAIGDEPLHSGFVEVIHPDGPEIYARHEYVVSGTRANERYGVVITIWPSDPACSGPPTFVLPVAVLSTNVAGNGVAEAVHTPEMLAALGIRGVTIGGEVTLYLGSDPAYATGCQRLHLD